MSSSTIDPRGKNAMPLALSSIGLLLLTCTALSFPGSAQPVSSLVCPPLSADEVVHNLIQLNLERAHALPAYRSTRIYRADYRGFPGSRSAEMVVDVGYEPPGTKTFSIRSQTG